MCKLYVEFVYKDEILHTRCDQCHRGKQTDPNGVGKSPTNLVSREGRPPPLHHTSNDGGKWSLAG